MSIASTLKPELAEALQALFKKLDPKESGSIRLSKLKENWNGSNDSQTANHLDTSRVIESVEKFAVNGSLSYERLCCGIKLSLIDDYSSARDSDDDTSSKVFENTRTTNGSNREVISKRDNKSNHKVECEKSFKSSDRSHREDEGKTNDLKLPNERKVETPKGEKGSAGEGSRDLFSVASKYNINFTPRCNSMQYESGYSTVVTTTPSDLTSTPLNKPKTSTSEANTQVSHNSEKLDDTSENLKLDLASLNLNDSKLSTKPEQKSKASFAYEDLKFSSRQNGKKETEVSLYSVSDKSLLSQSMLDTFGYHPPPEISPVEIRLPSYALPSTLSTAISGFDHEHQNVKKIKPFSGSNSEALNDNTNGSKSRSELNFSKTEENSLLRVYETESIEKSKSYSDNRSENRSYRDNGNGDSSMTQFRQNKSSKEMDSGNLHSDKSYFDRPKSALSQTSTYSVFSVSKSPIPPLTRGAYYEIDDNYEEENFSAHAEKDKVESVENGVRNDYNSEYTSKNYGFNGETSNVYESPSKSMGDSMYRTVPVFESTGLSWSPKPSSVDVSRSSGKVRNGKHEVSFCDEKSSSTAKAQINGCSFSQSSKGHDQTEFSTSSSGYGMSEVTRMKTNQSTSPLPRSGVLASSSSVADNAEKMDKMLDQALRAVNESYRLIRIGKKQLRNNSNSSSEGGGGGGGGGSGRGMGSGSHSPLPGGSEKYLRLMNCVLDLHKSLLDLIDTHDDSTPADLADGEDSCSQCGVCATCQHNLQTFHLAADQLSRSQSLQQRNGSSYSESRGRQTDSNVDYCEVSERSVYQKNENSHSKKTSTDLNMSKATSRSSLRANDVTQ